MRCKLTVTNHYGDVIMSAIASQITSLTIVYSTVNSDADQRKHQSSASLAFVWGIHRGPVNSPHKWPVTQKMFPFDDVIMVKVVTPVLRYNISIQLLVLGNRSFSVLVVYRLKIHWLPRNTIWCHRHGPTSAQVMPCCRMAPSHYPNQCWFINGI